MSTGLLTIVQNEPFFFPIWYDYYSKIFPPQNIHVLHHVLPDSEDERKRKRKKNWEEFLFEHHNIHKYNLAPVHNDVSFDHRWLLWLIKESQKELLGIYKNLVFAEVDEILALDPLKFSNNDLYGYINSVLTVGRNGVSADTISVKGYEIVNDFRYEAKLDPSQPILPQRKWWYPSMLYSKTLISNRPLEWCEGFHRVTNMPSVQSVENVIDRDVLLLHLHKLDYEFARDRLFTFKDLNMSNDGAGLQNRITREETLKLWWYFNIDAPGNSIPATLQLIPEPVKQLF